MNPEVLTPLLDWLDLAGVAIFALTGALVAAKERQTFVTLAFFALVTGVGGGTVRDLLIGAPVFWIHDGGVAVSASRSRCSRGSSRRDGGPAGSYRLPTASGWRPTPCLARPRRSNMGYRPSPPR